MPQKRRKQQGRREVGKAERKHLEEAEYPDT